MELLGIRIYLSIFLLSSFIFLHQINCNGQGYNLGKPTIDSNAYVKWQSVSDASISNDGKFVSYVIRNFPVGSLSMVIKSSAGDWEMRVLGARRIIFTDDSKFGIYTNENDSLFIIKLGGLVTESFSNVNSFQLKGNGNNEILAIDRRNGSFSELILYNCKKGKFRLFSNVERFTISENSKSLAVLRRADDDNENRKELNWISLDNNRSVTLWKGEGGIGNMVIDNIGSKLAYLTNDVQNRVLQTSCFLYRSGDKESRFLFTNQSIGIEAGVNITGLQGFSSDGAILLFNGETSDVGEKSRLSDYDQLNIWSYLDKRLKPISINNRQVEKYPFLYSFKVDDFSIHCLMKEGDIPVGGLRNGKALIWHIDPKSDMSENYWNKNAGFSYYLALAGTGERKPLEKIGREHGEMSPTGRFIIFSIEEKYYIYDITTREYRDLTADMSVGWYNYYAADRDSIVRGVAGWLKDDAGVFIYDTYDIWLFDPLGKKNPVNITNGYGRKNNIIFDLGLVEYSKGAISDNDRLILSAIGIKTKKNGFFEKRLQKEGDPNVLSFDSHVYHIIKNGFVSQKGQYPIRARDKEVFIVSRMSATESLNYFITKDFKQFTPISDVHPEKLFNWYTTELHSWRSVDGLTLQGLLYKPENFDSSKRYPVILNYYEKPSYNLNVCLTPNYSSSAINIPTYVSNGYLVFTPDIQYKVGDPMQGTYNSVVSAAHYLSKMAFVDEKKMGIQGFSFGGVQTNYLVANTELFAAACTASGLSDLVSAYGSVSVNGHSLQANYERVGQVRMGGTPWGSADMYVKNSAIFKVDKVVTPLLIMHTTEDAICPFAQALEFFTALRRLRKKVWLLEYKDGRHSLQGRSAVDFDSRMFQFFDHYLKDKPAPSWMTTGI